MDVPTAKIARKRPEYKAKAWILTTKKEQRAATRRAFASRICQGSIKQR
jgi:hypothetical protein